MSQAGAPAALGGYRVQALYTLKRILTSRNDNVVFQPEGLEDLDILKNARLAELVQVKRYDSLQLSDLTPQNPNSFLHRAVTVLNSTSPPSIMLVNFGNVGPEMARAWQGDGLDRQRIHKKLEQYGFLSADIDRIFDHIEIITLDETTEEIEIYQLLRDQHQLTGIDPHNAFDLLHAWIFSCMEKRQAIKLADTLDKMLSVGRFLAERRDHHDQWFSTILPLESKKIEAETEERLRKEFYTGGYTRYEHILSDLDFRRDEKLPEIKHKFEESNVVFIHAASGQGKTTLAYRYMHDNYSPLCCFTIARIQSVQHALSVANALNGHGRALQFPMLVYLDVHPRDTDWPVLVEQLAQHPYLRLLVTVREEDYRRAKIPGERFTFSEISLEFDEAEARLIFERARSETSYLDFESAWDAFDEGGPLLEFVHLLTQNTTLRQRLQGQVQRIQTEVKNKDLDPADLHLLRLVAVATAYEARIDTQKLVHHLDLRVPEQTFDYFQKEYLIRVSNVGYIEGLHALRSHILVDLLTSPDILPWLSMAEEVLPLLLNEDLETFLLHAFYEQTVDFIPTVVKYYPQTWRGRGGILRSLRWVGLRDYIEANQDIIDDARKEFGSGWYFILDMNFADDDTPSIGEWWQDGSLARFFSNDRIEKLNTLRARQTPRNNAFELVTQWLTQLVEPPLEPEISADWAGVVELLYWASRFKLIHIGKWISTEILDLAITSLALPILSDLSYALYRYDEELQQSWLEQHESTLETRLAQEYGIIYLEKTDTKSLLAHFAVEEEKLDKDAKDPFHAAASERLQLIRQLFPQFEKYGCQGYGHKLGSFYKLDVDSTQKPGVKKEYLVPDMVYRSNQIAVGIGRLRYRPETWLEYAEHLYTIRQLVATCLEHLMYGLGDALQNKKPVDFSQKHIENTAWNNCMTLLGDIPELPKIAVDKWGFASESSNRNTSESEKEKYVPKTIALRRYRSLLDAQRDYSSSIRNFMQQAIHVMATNLHLSRLKPYEDKENIIEVLRDTGYKTDLQYLSTHNLWEAKRSSINYQQEFEQLFGHLVDTAKLIEQERDLLNAVFPLWYFYAHEPESVKPSASRKVPLRFEQAQSRFLHKTQKALEKVTAGSEGLTAKLLSIHPHWQGESALWINLDVDNPIELNAENPLKLYRMLEEIVLPAFRNEIGPIRVQELSFYVIQEHFKRLVFVLTVRDRMFYDIIIPLDTAFTVLGEKELSTENWISFKGEVLPTDLREQLELELWESEGLNIANQFANSITGLMLVLSQVAEFANLPGMTEPGQAALQTHLESRSKQLNEIRELVFENAQFLQNRFEALSEEEKKDRKYLLSAHNYLTEFMDIIRPLAGNEEEKITLGLNDVKEYAELLAQIFLMGEVIRQHWVADFLTNIE